MIDASTFSLNKYPTKNNVDPQVLFDGLGSFWNQVFQDKDTVKGYTRGMAEEAIQNYYNLIEAVNGYSVKDVPILHKELWLPIIINKSEFNNVPLTFKKHDAVFGAQPTTDVFFQGVTFRFGFPKNPASQVFAFKPDSTFSGATAIANRILTPSLVMTNGVDYVLQDGVLFFNSNLFENDLVPKVDLIGDDGKNVTFVDANGVTQNEQFIIIWAYNADQDLDLLLNGFGYIFELNEADNEAFKELLKATFALHVEGPTVHSIRSIAATFLNIKPVVEATETVEEVFTDGINQIVVTDKNVYKFSLTATVLNSVIPGATFIAGDLFIDAVQYFDNVFFPKWWVSQIKSRIALSQYVFFGDYKQQFIVQNEPAILSVTSDGKVVFPILGDPADVQQFHDNLDHAAIIANMGLSNGDIIIINPLDFIFDNFIRDNTAMLKFAFDDSAESLHFLTFLPLLKANLPKHVYFIIALELTLTSDTYQSLNDAIEVEYPLEVRVLNADGSDSNGFINADQPQEVIDNPSDAVILIKNKLFSLGKGPALDNVDARANTNTGGELQINDGKVFTIIPAGASTAQIHTLSLLDFT